MHAMYFVVGFCILSRCLCVTFFLLLSKIPARETVRKPEYMKCKRAGEVGQRFTALQHMHCNIKSYSKLPIGFEFLFIALKANVANIFY